MRFAFPRILLFQLSVIFAIPCAPYAHGAGLRSPWDTHKIALTEAAYDCPTPPALARTLNLEPYYIDNHASVADPAKLAAFQKASEAPTHLSQSAALAADAFLSSGSRAAAACVYALLDAAAQARAWDARMAGFSGVYEQGWLLSAAAISCLKVRDSGVGTPQQQAHIRRWFRTLSGRLGDYFSRALKRRAADGYNNHLYWAGLAVGAAAIAENNRKDFKDAVLAYQIGVGQIQPDGSLPLEMDRGQMALHYHLYALGPLIMLAELGEANGFQMYADHDGAIHRLVQLCAAGLADPTIFEKRTGVVQVAPRPYSGSDIGWAVPYVRRFPSPQLSAWIAQAPWVRSTSWGGAPPE